MSVPWLYGDKKQAPNAMHLSRKRVAFKISWKKSSKIKRITIVYNICTLSSKRASTGYFFIYFFLLNEYPIADCKTIWKTSHPSCSHLLFQKEKKSWTKKRESWNTFVFYPYYCEKVVKRVIKCRKCEGKLEVGFFISFSKFMLWDFLLSFIYTYSII